MKYVRFRRRGEDRFLFTVAPTRHADLADAMIPAGWSPVSAGFVLFSPVAGVQVCGRSESLGLVPNPLDARLIDMLYAATTRLAVPAVGS